MSKNFFENFPNILYNGISVKNISLRTVMYTDVLKNYHSFYPYTVEDNETAQYVADFYYGSEKYDWLVFMSNQVIDPYYEWPLSTNDFNKFIKKKYGSIETALTGISHYVYNENVDVNSDDVSRVYNINRVVSPTTYQFMSIEERSFWSPVRFYDHENIKNENRRNIQLLSAEYLPRVVQEMSTILIENE